jgi:hypothetical protein
MACIAQHEAENLAKTGHGLPPLEGVGVLVFGGLDEGQLPPGEQLVVVGAQSQVIRNAFWPGGIGKALGTPRPVRFGGDLLAELRPVVLTRGVVHMGSECSAFAPQMRTAS